MLTSRLGFDFTRKFFALASLSFFFIVFSDVQAQQEFSSESETGMGRSSIGLRIPSALSTSRAIFGNFAGTDTSTIRLRKKIFGSQKFIYGENEPQNVYDFLGIAYRREFRDVLSIHPVAEKEANKASAYNVVKMLGTLTFLGMNVKLLIDSVNDAQDVSAGRFPDGSSNSSGDLAIMVVAGGVMIVSGILAKKHLKNGVKMFNERQQLKRQRKTSQK